MNFAVRRPGRYLPPPMPTEALAPKPPYVPARSPRPTWFVGAFTAQENWVCSVTPISSPSPARRCARSPTIRCSPTQGHRPGPDGALAIGIGMGLAGIGGMLVGLDTSIDPLIGFRAILSVFAAAVVGGLGSIPGAVVGGLAIGLAEELSLSLLPATYKSAVGFLAIVVILTCRPQGLLGRERVSMTQLSHRDGDLRRDLRAPRARPQRDVGHGRDGQSRHRRLLRLRRLRLGAAHREAHAPIALGFARRDGGPR